MMLFFGVVIVVVVGVGGVVIVVVVGLLWEGRPLPGPLVARGVSVRGAILRPSLRDQ